MKLVLGLAVAAVATLAGCDQYQRPIEDLPKVVASQKAELPKGETAKVATPATKSAATAPAKIAAPAVAGAEIIVDDKDDGFKVVSGKWNAATGDYFKDSVHWAVKADDASAVASFTPTIVTAGEYEVFEYHGENPSNDHASDAVYTIKFDGGSKEVKVDQTDKIGKWNSLGTFKFAAGNGGSVTISNKANDNVLADAVKFVKK